MASAPILPAGLACPPALLQQALADMGRGELDAAKLPEGCVSVDDVKNAAAHMDGVDADHFVRAVLNRRAGFLEHALNDYAGHPPERMWGGLEERYRDGRAFSLTFVERTTHHADLAMANVIDGAPGFDLDARYVPLHPQEAQTRGLAESTGSVPWSRVRGTAAGRTVRPCSSADSHILIKCDFSHVIMDRKPRPLDVTEAAACIKTSDYLYTALAARPCPVVAFLPEVAARIDRAHDIAALLRHDVAYPPADATTWHLPLYCLWSDAGDVGSPQPLLITFVDEATRAGTRAADALIDIVLRPIIEAAAYLFIDLGCAHSAHGQNWRFELSPQGRPTGRIIFTDLGDIWEDPLIAEDNGFALNWNEDEARAFAQTREADLGGAFVDFVLYELLHRALLCFERTYGSDPALRLRVNDIVGEAVEKRRDRVTHFRDGPLQWFYSTYLA